MFVFQLKQMEPVKTEAQKEQEIKQIATRLRATDLFRTKGAEHIYQFARSIHAYFEKNKMNEFARENKFSEISNALKDISNYLDKANSEIVAYAHTPAGILLENPKLVIWMCSNRGTSELAALANAAIAEAFLNNPKRIAWAFIELEKIESIADKTNPLYSDGCQFDALRHELIAKAFSENPERIVQLFKNLTKEMRGIDRAQEVFLALGPIGEPRYPDGKWEATNFVLARAFLENPEKLIHDFVELYRAGALLLFGNILMSEYISESFVADPERLTRAFAGLAKALSPTDFMTICDGINATESVAITFSKDPQKGCDKILKLANALGSQFEDQGSFLLKYLTYNYVDYVIDKITLDELLEKLSRALENQKRQNQK